MAVRVVVQRAAEHYPAPVDGEFQRWAKAGLRSFDQDAELTIRIVGEAESCRLNSDYRDKASATNVLSFPTDLPEDLHSQIEKELEVLPLGDLVLCAPVINREAEQQGKPVADHWAHLVVHGILHLLGHDHQDDEEALTMERIETEILAELGIADPYRPR